VDRSRRARSVSTISDNDTKPAGAVLLYAQHMVKHENKLIKRERQHNHRTKGMKGEAQLDIIDVDEDMVMRMVLVSVQVVYLRESCISADIATDIIDGRLHRDRSPRKASTKEGELRS